MLAALGIEICFPLMSMNRLIGILLVGGKDDGAPFTKRRGVHLLAPPPGRHRPGKRPPLQGAAGALPPHVARRPPGHDRRAGRRRRPRDPQPADGHPVLAPVSGVQEEDETSRQLLAAALRETGRIDEIVSALLAFSRPDRDRARAPRPARGARGEPGPRRLPGAHQQSGRAPRIPRGPLPLQGDKSQLKQLFLNIFLNAIQAMPAGGS